MYYTVVSHIYAPPLLHEKLQGPIATTTAGLAWEEESWEKDQLERECQELQRVKDRELSEMAIDAGIIIIFEALLCCRNIIIGQQLLYL